MTHDSHGVVSCISVDPYTWTLAKVCAQVAAAGPEQFRGVERVLVRHLLARLLRRHPPARVGRVQLPGALLHLQTVSRAPHALTRYFQETESRNREFEPNIY